MKPLSIALLLLVAACATTPGSPPSEGPSLCAGIADCTKPLVAVKPAAQRVLAKHGISADKTVQLMVQSPMLIGGKPADPTEWQASVYASYKSGGSSASCSATLVGERTLFMASHCMPNGGVVTFSAGANRYTARCTHHPEYRGNSTADWALCLVDRPVTGVPFEVLGIDQTVALKESLLLAGYGCIKPGGGGGNDGIFRIGAATVTGLPGGKSYDIVTRGGSALCFGDSGGSVYKTFPDGARYIVGVNSRGDIATMSYLPAVYSKTFVSWATDWAKTANNVRVCGLHLDALGCRHSDVTPPPQSDGKFEVTSAAACVRGVVTPEYLPKKDAIVEGVKKALDSF